MHQHKDPKLIDLHRLNDNTMTLSHLQTLKKKLKIKIKIGKQLDFY